MLRRPTFDELRLLRFLIEKAGVATPKDWSEKLLVDEMNDQGMGSLRLFPEGVQTINCKFGRRSSDCQFTDEDGIEVIVSLNLDQFGNLYELDIWKTDFEKLMRIPQNVAELRRVDEG